MITLINTGKLKTPDPSCYVRKIWVVCLLAFIIAFSCPHEAMAKKAHHHRAAHHSGAPVDRGASYADIVIDADTGRVLHATASNDLRHPASLTKMMTLYLTFQALEAGRLNMNQYLPISENAAAQSPSKLGLHAGQRIRVEDAILGLVTESANDAAVTLGEWMGNSEEGFGQMMTRQARALGMTRTQFRNPSGLPDPDQVTTAHDMAVLGAALIRHFPQYYPYFSRDSFTYAGINHHNHNHLMERYSGMDGIKTGYIRASGFNLVASARRGGHRLIAAVFGGHSAVARDNRMAELLDESFAIAPRVLGPPHAVEAANDTNESAQGDAADTAAQSPQPVQGPSIALPPKIAAIFPRDVERHDSPMRDGSPRGNVINPSSGWGVQIGAYSNPEVGQQALAGLISSLPQILGSAQPDIQPVAVGNSTMYRARLMGLDTKTAQEVCAYLTQRGTSCLTVGP